jgi:hypothetical protein
LPAGFPYTAFCDSEEEDILDQLIFKNYKGIFSVYPGSGIRIFPILDPGSRVKEDSRIRIRIKEFKYFNPKTASKLSSCRIPDPVHDFLPIPDPVVKKAPDPGSGSPTQATLCMYCKTSVAGSN